MIFLIMPKLPEIVCNEENNNIDTRFAPLFMTDKNEMSSHDYHHFFKNESSSNAQINLFSHGVQHYADEVEAGTTNNEVFYTSEIFQGLITYDSVTITFSNGKGFRCSSFNDTGYCIPNRENILLTRDEFTHQDTNFTYTISETDYQNAYSLE